MTMPFILVGVSGYAQSGKDSFGKFLVDDHDYYRFAFADQLKDCLYALNPAIGNNTHTGHTVFLKNLYDSTPGSREDKWEECKKVTEVRRLLQRLGTEVGREILGENIWIESTFRKIVKLPVDPSIGFVRCVITDMRFINEAEAIRESGGFTVRVHRPGVGPARDNDGHVHQSEIALDDWNDWDFHVHNDGTLDDLKEKAQRHAKKIEEMYRANKEIE